MKFTTNYKGYRLVTVITKTSKYTTVYRNGFSRFVGDLMDCINYVDSVFLKKND